MLVATPAFDVFRFAYGMRTCHDFDQKFGIIGRGDVPLLHAYIKKNLSFFGIIFMVGYSGLDDFVNPVVSNLASEISQFRREAG
jgi:hypothetical protein